MSHRKSMVLAFALAGALSLTAVSMPAAFAADTGTSGQVNAAAAPQANNDEFTIDADGVLVAYTGGATDIRIPEGVTEISSNAFTNAQLTSVWNPRERARHRRLCLRGPAAHPGHLPGR